jgi:hypothetical protein
MSLYYLYQSSPIQSLPIYLTVALRAKAHVMSHPILKMNLTGGKNSRLLYIHTYGLNVIRGVYKALMLLLEEMGVLASDRSMVSLTIGRDN